MVAMTTLAEQARKHRPLSRPESGESSRLIVVANRLPVHQERQGKRTTWKRSPGGLVSAVAPFVEQFGGAWVGWPGPASDGGSIKPFTHDGIDIRPLTLGERELDSFYYGFSNTTLWPLYHDGIRPPVFRRSWWRHYVDVNRRYAEAAALLGVFYLLIATRRLWAR
jgi:trehalose 6-phosphate synthase